MRPEATVSAHPLLVLRIEILFKTLLIFAFALLLTGCSVVGYRGQRQLVTVPVYHTVRPGETLTSIATVHRVTPKSIALLNGIHDPASVKPGSKLLVRYSTRLEEVPYRPGEDRVAAVDPASAPPSNGSLLWPLAVRGTLTSRYGSRWGRHHDGVDIAAPVGTPIVAAHTGTVIYADERVSGYGKMVIVRDRRGFLTVYAHSRRFLCELGDTVKRGTPIAEVGMTGRTTGPHLHFELRLRTSGGDSGGGSYRAVDPLPYLLEKKGDLDHR